MDQIQALVARYAQGWTQEATEIDTYLARQVADDRHREVIGPLVPASGGSGVLLAEGHEVASWGD
ncbi:MAG: serine hydrolase domain-containing protein, partial [Acidimicrobiales bacterium]